MVGDGGGGGGVRAPSGPEPVGEEGGSVEEQPPSLMRHLAFPPKEVASGVFSFPAKEAGITGGRRSGSRVRDGKKEGTPASG